MDLEAASVQGGLLWAGHFVCWPLAIIAAARADWRALGEHGRLHVYLGTITALLLLWQLRAGEPPGPYVHFLGATVLTLVFGWRLAIVAGVILVVANMVAGTGSWASVGLNATICAVVPASVSFAVERAVDRHLPRNPFVFVLVCGFAGAAIAVLATGTASALLLAMGTDIGSDWLVERYLVLYLLLPYPEGFVTGAVMVWLAMFYPQWVRAYRDPEP